MATAVGSSSRVARAHELVRTAVVSPSCATAVAGLVYLALSLAFFGLPTLPHLGRSCSCAAGTDPETYMWALAWWPHALLHGTNPFVTNALFVPDRIDLGGATLVPGAALVMTPVTLLLGPIFAYNLVAIASPALAALFAFLLCRYVTGGFAASMVGGFLFGFSSYMLGHQLGHLNLVLTFPVPAGVHLVLRLMEGRISDRRFVLWMAADLVALLLFSTEVALTFVLLGGLAFGLSALLVPSERTRLALAVKWTAAAGVLAAIVASPVIFYALRGNVTRAIAKMGDFFGADALGFVVPTQLTGLGHSLSGGVAAHFNSGDIAESGVYLGVPLVLIIVHYVVTRWRIPVTRLLFSLLVVIVVLMLGSHLHVNGHKTIPLPWSGLATLPLLKQAVPLRLGLYMFLIVGIVVALWIRQPGSTRQTVIRWAAVAVAVAFVFPNVGSGLWHSQPPNRGFFTTAEYKRYLHPQENVLAFPWGPAGDSMLWQAETGFSFRMAGGYIGRLIPANYQREGFVAAVLADQATNDPRGLASFIERRHVGAVIVDATAPQPWSGLLKSLGLRGQLTGGVLYYRVPGAAP